MDRLSAPDPSSFETLPPERAHMFGRPGPFTRAHFPSLVGLVLEEVRADYCRMTLPFRPELNQPAGVVHGGVIATLIDTAVVPAVGAAYDQIPMMVTLSLNINYLDAVRGEDMVAHGWVTRRGRSIVFCSALVTTAAGTPAAKGDLVYKVRA